jgi:hypothetical protein
MSNPDGTPPFPEDTRDEAQRLEDYALDIARRCAKAKPKSYYSEPFQPHEWALDAIMEALLWSERKHLAEKVISNVEAGLRHVVTADADARLERINMLACYASEEDTSAQAAALLEIGKLARKEMAP